MVEFLTEEQEEAQRIEKYKYLLDNWDRYILKFVWSPGNNKEEALEKLMAQTMTEGKSSMPLSNLCESQKILLLQFIHRDKEEVIIIEASEKLVEKCLIDMNYVPTLCKWYVEQLITDFTLRRI